ncbi:MAG: hypothetical protein BWY19_00758 [bacterium ADurb.Bin212]|nr:MAG: hypothetical protein BWY19_00758 [bacterium ADurb.Bin212]
MWQLALLAVFVPWIIGLVAIIRYFVKKKSTSSNDAINKLESSLGRIKNSTDKEGYLLALKYLKGEDTQNYLWPEDTQITSSEATTEPLASQNAPANIVQVQVEREKPKSHGLKSIDNINILLYIGAFLIVVAVGIFIGFNYQLLSGEAKTIFLVLFTLLFYCSGLYLYLKTEKLKPAGETFATIGVILFPLCGLAYYKFVLDSTSGNIVWFITSLLTLLFYILTIKYFKKIYLNYLLSFVILSIFESSLSLFEVPIYYFFWGMVIFALLTKIFSANSKHEVALNAPLNLISIFLTPVSLLAALFLVSEHGWMPVGINLILASIYYFLSSLITLNKEYGSGFLFISLVLLPLGLSAIMHDQGVANLGISFVWLAISLLCPIITNLFGVSWLQSRKDSLSAVSAVLVIVAVFINFQEPLNLSYSLLAALLISGYSYAVNRKILSLIVANLSLAILPYIYFMSATALPLGVEYLASIYAALSAVLAIIIAYNKNISGVVFAVEFIAFVIMAIFGIVLIYGSGISWLIMVIMIAYALMLLLLSSNQKNKLLDLVSALLIYIAFKQIAEIGNYEDAAYAWVLSGLGILFYWLSISGICASSRAAIWRIAGLFGPYIAIIYAFNNFYVYDGYAPTSLIVAIAGAMSLFDAYRRESKLFKYFSGGVLIVALNYFMRELQIEEQHIYYAVWAVYLWLLAYNEHKSRIFSARDLFAVIGMVLLTVPLFFQATGYNGQIYGVVLGFESIFLLLYGMYYRYKLAKWWGIVCLIIIVTDQLKDAIFALPKWAIIGVVGLLFLVGATYLLSKRENEKKE